MEKQTFAEACAEPLHIPQWEYMVKAYLPDDYDLLIAAMEYNGAKGWELIQVTDKFMFYKRPTRLKM